MTKLLLLCSLISTANAVPTGVVSTQYVDNANVFISVLCIGTTEYVIASKSSSVSITQALDKNGKPIQCSVN